MQLIETNTEGLKREYKVTVPAGAIAVKVNARLAEIAKSVRLPGFRPGKAPVALITKRYGKSVMGEVLDATVQETVGAAMAERRLRPATQPKIEITSFEEGKDLEFTMAVEVFPEVEAIDFATLEIERPRAEVDDAAIDSALQRLSKRQVRTEVVSEPREAKLGDTAVIDFDGSMGGTPIVGGSGQDYSLELGSKSFVPGFEDALIGAKAGDSRTFTVTFPEQYHTDLAGKDAEFVVTVKELRQPAEVAIDDELAKSFGVENVEALRKTVREQLEREFAGFSRQRAKRALLDRLSDRYSFEVPSGMADAEFAGIWTQFEDGKKRGINDPADAGKSEDELRAEYRELAVRRVRLGVLLAEIGRKNNITVTQEDLNRALVAEASNYPGQEKMVLEYYRKTEGALDSLRAPLFEEKVVDFLLEMAKITDKTVSVAELTMEQEEEGGASS